jgi:hypothetical protein
LYSSVNHKNKLTVPESIIRKWINLSDLEDRVAINYDLNDDYGQNSHNVKIDDFQVFNDYVIDGERNPHKSYGYLRSKQLADIIVEFCKHGKSRFRLWMEKILLNKFYI